VEFARADVGVSVAVLVAELYATETATAAPPELSNWKFVVVTVVALSDSLKVTDTTVCGLTLVAPFAGDTDVTVGGVVSLPET